MKYEILQLESNNNYKPYLFFGYQFATEHGFNIKDYKKVYEGDAPLYSDCTPNDVLEDLFIKFNCHRPEDFKGRSLSTSDIVKLGNKYYYCDSIGWVELQ